LPFSRILVVLNHLPFKSDCLKASLYFFINSNYFCIIFIMIQRHFNFITRVIFPQKVHYNTDCLFKIGLIFARKMQYFKSSHCITWFIHCHKCNTFHFSHLLDIHQRRLLVISDQFNYCFRVIYKRIFNGEVNFLQILCKKFDQIIFNNRLKLSPNISLIFYCICYLIRFWFFFTQILIIRFLIHI